MSRHWDLSSHGSLTIILDQRQWVQEVRVSMNHPRPIVPCAQAPASASGHAKVSICFGSSVCAAVSNGSLLLIASRDDLREAHLALHPGFLLEEFSDLLLLASIALLRLLGPLFRHLKLPPEVAFL